MQEWEAILIGVVIATIVNLIWNFAERKERLRVVTFQRRLEIYQQAFSWNQRAYYAWYSRDVQNIRNIVEEGRNWWNENSLYLDKRTRLSLWSVFNSMDAFIFDLEHPQEEPTPIGKNVWDNLNVNQRHITDGIGVEHLPTIPEVTTTPEQNQPNRRRRVLATLNRGINARWVRRYLIRGLFIVGVVAIIGMIIFIYLQIPVSDNFTLAAKSKVICVDTAAFFGLVAAYFATNNRWLNLILTTAIDIFIAGMFFELITVIETVH